MPTKQSQNKRASQNRKQTSTAKRGRPTKPSMQAEEAAAERSQRGGAGKRSSGASKRGARSTRE